MNNKILGASIVCSLLLVTITLLVFSKSMFNLKEIDTLVTNAEKENKSYEVVITNKFTNDYYFELKD